MEEVTSISDGGPVRHQRVTKFNSLLLMFITDLSATVPDASSLSSARDWLQALTQIDPDNDKILRMFMQALAGAQEFITDKNPTVFKELNFLPSIINTDEIWMIFNSLSEEDKGVCWKYVSKLYREGVASLKELGVDVASLDAAALRERGEGALKMLREATPRGAGDLKDAVIPDGPIVTAAFSSLCQNYVELFQGVESLPASVTSRLAELTDAGDATDFLAAFTSQYPDCGQEFMQDPAAVMAEHGYPFLPVDQRKGISAALGREGDERVAQLVMQMGTVGMALQSVDEKTLSAVEEVARNFLGMVQNGEMDLGDVGSDPFALLQKLASSGAADDLMQMLGAVADAN